MKIWTAASIVALAAAAASCGSASPGVTVTCSAVQAIAASGAPGTVRIVQSVSFVDNASGSTQPLPLANADVRIISPIPTSATVCPGKCAATDTFSADTKVTTDNDGLLIYTVQLVGGTTSQGSLIESFSGQSPAGCAVAFSTS